MRNGLCANCPDAQWANNKPPVCSEIFNMLCWDLGAQTAFIFGVKRTGIKSLKLLKAQLKQCIPFSGIPAHLCFKIELQSKPENAYFIPSFTIHSQCTEEEAHNYHGLAERFTMQSMEAIDPEAMNGNGH